MHRKRKLARLILSISFFVTTMSVGSRAQAQTLDENTLKDMLWRLVGPFRGGRAVAVEGVTGDSNTYYFGSVAGGVWKTTNGGISWIPIFDKQRISSIGSIAVAPSDANVIYVGTGEACLRGDVSFGDGVYKSVDAGKTWTHVGLEETRHIGRIIVDPHNPNIVFVAALGHAYGANEERGVFRSIDGGKTWGKVLFKNDKTGAIDITFDPSNAHILYAALWEVNRTPWNLSSGGTGSGLYKSADSGLTWKLLLGPGLPKGVLGRIGIAVSANTNCVFALIEAEEGGLYRSDDAGESWKKISDDHRFRQRAWYFTRIFSDPKSDSTVYILNTEMYRSMDGGKSFEMLHLPHDDRHDLWIDPGNPARMIEGDDGGATITNDGGKSWTSQQNQPTGQFYHVGTDNDFPYRLYGSQQDSSTVSIASRSDYGAIGRADWYPVGGGECGFVVPDPANPNIVYAGSYGGLISRFDKRDNQAQIISAWPFNPMGHGAVDLKYRFQWTAPIAISPFDSNILYHAADVLFKTADGGKNWSIISPDLTRNDKSKQQSSGGPITQDNTSVEYYDTIFAVAESPVEKGLIWVGTDDGLVHMTRDGGKNWTDVTPKDLPEWSLVSLIDPSPHAAGSAYLAVDRHRLDDFQAYVYKTKDYGKTWTKIANGLPSNYVHAVREDRIKKGLLFAGTETGVYVSFDDGSLWQPLQLNLPAAPIYDLVVHGNDLVVATHGRGFWILDDISPLRQLSEQSQGEVIHLYAPSVAYRVQGGSNRILQGMPLGENPPDGAIINFTFREKPKDDEIVSLAILDSQGKVIRNYSRNKEKTQGGTAEGWQSKKPKEVPAEAGLNRFVWDLRYEPPIMVPGAVSWEATSDGPMAVPGKFVVRLTVGSQSVTAPLEVKEDPRIETSQSDLQEQLNLALRIRDRVTEADTAVNQMREVDHQLDALKKRAETNRSYSGVVDDASMLTRKITELEESIIQPKSISDEDPLNYPSRVADQLMALAAMLEHADTAPTRASYALFDDLSRQLDERLAKWKEIQEADLAALNGEIRKMNIPLISILAESLAQLE